MPSGKAPRSVKANMPHVRSIPTDIVDIIVDKDIGIPRLFYCLYLRSYLFNGYDRPSLTRYLSFIQGEIVIDLRVLLPDGIVCPIRCQSVKRRVDLLAQNRIAFTEAYGVLFAAEDFIDEFVVGL